MRKKKIGMSLIEVLIITSLIITLSFFVYPAFSAYSKNQGLKNSAKQIVADLRLAQQLAVTKQIKHSLRVIPMSYQYQIIKKGAPETVEADNQISSYVIFSQISGLVNNEAVFNSAGAVDYAGDIYLTHQQTGLIIKISIKPSGYVTIENL